MILEYWIKINTFNNFKTRQYLTTVWLLYWKEHAQILMKINILKESTAKMIHLIRIMKEVHRKDTDFNYIG